MKLPSLTVVRFKKDHPDNNAYQMTQQGLFLNKRYYVLGEIKQTPGHVVLLQVAHDRPARIYDMIHPDRFEAVPEDEL